MGAPDAVTHTQTADPEADRSRFSIESEGDEQPTSIRPPSVIKQYEIIRKLGEGGMGAVFLARDTKLGRLVAIKLLLREGADDRLLAEAQATARPRHENIVVIHEIDEYDGLPYMVLEYLEGRTLRAFLQQPEHTHGVPPNLAVEMGIAVLSALSCAHKLGIVHRDLKPENIFLLDSGQLKVLDFGIARHYGAGIPDIQDEHARRGTLAYMAPEQWLGEDTDPRCDFWSFGILLYELLTGLHPLAPLTREGLASVVTFDVPMPRLLDIRPDLAQLSSIIEHCLQKGRAERIDSAEAIRSALESLRSDLQKRGLVEGESPFAGLATFGEADARRFFGRDRDVGTVVGRLQHQRLIAVTGPSGAGKSSFVRAGVIPALKRSANAWEAFVVRPGRRPLSALASILVQAHEQDVDDIDNLAATLRAQPGMLGSRLRAYCRKEGYPRRALLVIDQFEELYTVSTNPDERNAFLACLEGVADDVSSPLRLVLTIRSDFLDRMAEDRHFMADLARGLFFLPPMGKEELREALTRPLELLGHRYESEKMVDAMLEALMEARCPLPLLQFTAAKLWEARDSARRVLTQESYERLGGVAGALSQHADAVIAALSAREKLLCRAICLRLVTPERTRAVVGLRELCDLTADERAVRDVIERLSEARLLLVETDQGQEGATVEFAHESMIDRWPELKRWLEESAEDAQFLARLRAAAGPWEASGEAEGLLWRDRAADEARHWLDRRQAEPGRSESAPIGKREERFLLAVVALSERARKRVQRIVAGAFTFLSAIAIVVIFFWIRADQQASRADAQKKRADEEAATVRAQNEVLAMEALRGRNAARMIAARERLDDPTQVLALLREIEPQAIPRGFPELLSWALHQGFAHAVRSYEAGINSLAFSPDGSHITALCYDHTVRVLNGDGTEELRSLRGHEGFIKHATWSTDGRRVVTASADMTARVWDIYGGGEPLVLRGHTAAVSFGAFSPDGRRIVTTSDDKTARIWSARGEGKPRVLHHDRPLNSATWSADSTHVMTAADNGVVQVWALDDDSDKPITSIHPQADGQAIVVFNGRGDRFATAARDRIIRVWDATSRTEIATLRGHEDKIMSLIWSPDDKQLVTTSKDKTVRLWSADGLGEPLILRGHTHWVHSAAFSPDGGRLVSGSLDKTTRTWDLRAIHPRISLVGHEEAINSANFSADGQRIVTASNDRTARIWSADGTGAPLVLRGHTDRLNQNASFSPEGKRLLTVSYDKTARIWNTDGSGNPLVLSGFGDPLFRGAWSSSGDRVIVTSSAGSVFVWKSDGTGQPVVFRTPGQDYANATLSPDGQRIAIVYSDHSVKIWKADGTGEPTVLRGLGSVQDLPDWSPDGDKLLTASSDNLARITKTDGSGDSIVFRGHEAVVTAARFSPDGKRFVTASLDKTARVWNADGTGQPIILRGHEEALKDARFSPDGKRILTTSDDKTTRVWNADGSGIPVVLGGMTTRPNSARWSPDGTRVVVAADEKNAYVWTDVEPLRGLDDPMLWRATTYCMPADVRVVVLGVNESAAHEGEETCKRRVKEAISAPQ